MIRVSTKTPQTIDSGSFSTSESGDSTWIKISKLANSKCGSNFQLSQYVQNAQRRIRRRNQACQAWKSKYYPKRVIRPNSSQKCHLNNVMDETQASSISSKSSSFKSMNDLSSNNNRTMDKDKNLDDKKKDHCDIQINNVNYDNDSEVEDDGNIPEPLALTAMRPEQASSMYQLNYFDFSDEEGNSDERKSKRPNQSSELNVENDSQHLSDETNPTQEPPSSTSLVQSKPIKSIRSKLNHNRYAKSLKKSKFNAQASSSSCSCLTNLPDLLRFVHTDDQKAEAEVQSSTNDDDDDMDKVGENEDFELDNFLAALDCLPSPGQCSSHFIHLGPIISYPPIDDPCFLEKLNEFEPISPTTDDKIVEDEVQSIEDQSIQIPRLDYDQFQDEMKSVTLDTPESDNQSVSSATSQSSNKSLLVGGGIGNLNLFHRGLKRFYNNNNRRMIIIEMILFHVLIGYPIVDLLNRLFFFKYYIQFDN